MKFLAGARKNFINANLKKPALMLKVFAVTGLFAVLVLRFIEAGLNYRRTEQALENERRKLSKQNAVSFSRVALTPRPNQNVQIIQSPKNTRAVARFQNAIFAATDGGLLQMSENGEILRHFTVLDGLPESDLTTLCVFGSRLFTNTNSKDLINFDGEKFEANFKASFFTENDALPRRSVTQISLFKNVKYLYSAVSTATRLFLLDKKSRRSGEGTRRVRRDFSNSGIGRAGSRE